MSVALERLELTTSLPLGWFAMPDPEAPEARIWPYEMVGRMGFRGGQAVSALVSLADALERARRQARPRRLRWVLMREPSVPIVQAWARLDLVPRTEPDAAVAADRWERGARDSPSGEDAGVWQREVGRRTVHDDPAVVIHDLLVVRPVPDAEQRLQHRVVVTRFPVEPLVLSLSVSTPLLAAIPDLEATAHEIAAGISIGDPA